jgi:hypothetical protein
MARKPTLTDQTNAASHELFKAAVARLGQRTDPGTDRRLAVLVDGVALGDRQNEMRRPGTAFYEQTFSEANAVAHLATKLGLDREGTVDVLRRLTPMPDAELTVNGTTVAFVEQTMVMDQQAHLLTLNVEALNTLIMSAEDPALRAHLERGMLVVRLNEIQVDYYATGLPVEVLVEEVVRFAQSRQEDTPPMKIDRSAFPVLGSMRALGLFRVPGKTYSPVSPIVDHGRPVYYKTPKRRRRADPKEADQGCRVPGDVPAALVAAGRRSSFRLARRHESGPRRHRSRDLARVRPRYCAANLRGAADHRVSGLLIAGVWHIGTRIRSENSATASGATNVPGALTSRHPSRRDREVKEKTPR